MDLLETFQTIIKDGEPYTDPTLTNEIYKDIMKLVENKSNQDALLAIAKVGLYIVLFTIRKQKEHDCT
ncbi:MAG: hypothetical protein GY861_18820 [bacterium]|nr:hypothetical protein [bacterium]